MNSRRNFLKLSSMVGAAGIVTACGQGGNGEAVQVKASGGKFDHLPNMMQGIDAISVDEHKVRVAKHRN